MVGMTMEDTIAGFVTSNFGNIYFCAFGLFLVLETAAPLRVPQSGQLLRWISLIGLAVINNVVLRWAASIAGMAAAYYAQSHGWGLFNFFDAPLIIELSLTVLLVDLTLYGCHRLYHASNLLWRFHSVHHSDRVIDIFTGLRFHPFEACANGLAVSGVALLLGLPPIGLLIHHLIIGVDSLFGHSNINTPLWLDRPLSLFVVTPRFHHIHHATGEAEHHMNFGIVFTFWDRLFGTDCHRNTAFLQSAPAGISGCEAGHRFQLPWLLAQPFIPLRRTSGPNVHTPVEESGLNKR